MRMVIELEEGLWLDPATVIAVQDRPGTEVVELLLWYGHKVETTKTVNEVMDLLQDAERMAREQAAGGYVP